MKLGPVKQGTNSRPVTGVGWLAYPGDVIGFAISSKKCVTKEVGIYSLSGKKVGTIPTDKYCPQQLPKDTLENGANFKISSVWKIPTNIKSGIYFFDEFQSNIYVIVRPRPSSAEYKNANGIRVLVPTNTFNAYSMTFGKNLYTGGGTYDFANLRRPITNSHFNAWIGVAQWLYNTNSFGREVIFLGDLDMETSSYVNGSDVLISLGHSEYWTRKGRKTFDSFIDRGGNSIFMGGNAMWWQVRYEGTKMVCYRDDKDPVTDPKLKTILWTQESLEYPTLWSLAGDYRFGGLGKKTLGVKPTGTGEILRSYSLDYYRLAQTNNPLFQGTGLGQCDALKVGSIGEYDGAPILGLSSTGIPVPDTATTTHYKTEILGFDWLNRSLQHITVGTMHLTQRTSTSGVLLNFGALTCCDSKAFGSVDAAKIKRIIANFIFKTRTNQQVFSTNPVTEVAYPFTTPSLVLPPILSGKCAPPNYPRTASTPSPAAKMVVPEIDEDTTPGPDTSTTTATTTTQEN
jgi:hypothetical protein